MKKTWFNRLLLSYFPILFITITVIIFLAVSIINEISIRETENSNRIFSKYVVDSIDTSLRGVERIVLEEMVRNDRLKSFFQPNWNEDQRLANYNISREIDIMISNNALIDSFYLYRAQDQTIISRSLILKLDEFADKEFVLEAYGQPAHSHWSPARDYAEFPGDQRQKVISLSKKALLPFGSLGLVVVNVRVDSLLGIVDDMINRNITFMDIWSGDHDRIYPPQLDAGRDDYETQASQGHVVSQIYSEYIGWNFVSGLKAGKFFGWISFISRIWLGIGVAAIAVSVAYIFYVTRRNYEPIARIVEQIQAHQSRSGTKTAENDEFSFIARVLGNLIDQTQWYEKRHQEDLFARKKQCFFELIDGGNDISLDYWQANAHRFSMPVDFRHLAFAVIEIDRYAEFQRSYTSNDQNLLKFAMTNVIHEFIGMDGRVIWSEWISGPRLAVLLISNEDKEPTEAGMYTALDKFRIWTMVNLKKSVTVGFGGTVDDVGSVHAVYEQAITALQYKMSLGANQVISFAGLKDIASKDTYKYVQMVNSMLYDFRVKNDAWEALLEQFFDSLEDEVLKNEEIHYILTYMIGLFNREMDSMPLEAAQFWTEQAHPCLLKHLEEADTLEDVRPRFVALLKELFEKYSAIRKSMAHYGLINNIRKYIEENYSNPDLSLNHISERFNINGKYASQLFKEEFGMKFVDFLVTLRMDHAKKLLVETDESIQDISVKVGYVHSISFGRTFKKVVGVTPGDYRKYAKA